MPPFYLFTVKQEASIEQAWTDLEDFGIELLYSSEDMEGHKEIFGKLTWHMTPEKILLKINSIDKITLSAEPSIDWVSQWSAFGLNYHEGFVHLHIGQMGGVQTDKWSVIRLQPGPGFGDLSHATTRLITKLMINHLRGKDILDVGTGSGVLALTAVAMQAKSVWGIDIDSQAVVHAKLNAEFNDMQDLVSFGRPEEHHKLPQTNDIVILMNMILSEQKLAWQMLTALAPYISECFVSGILAEEKDQCITDYMQQGWQFQELLEEEGWLALHFIMRR